MKVIARLVRTVGLDQLHVGTFVGKMYETKKEVLENCAALKEKMLDFKQVMPVASGGLQPLHVPELLKIFGKDVVIQMGGGMHALATIIGARAARQAIDAANQKINLRDYAKNHMELKIAMGKWGKQ